MSDPDAIIRKLRDVIEKEQGLADLLERSLKQARESAEAELRPELFAALEWPANLDEYEEYLKSFVRWVPRQSDAEAWQGADPAERQAQEVSDRTAHFFFLVDQGVDGAAPQGSKVFRDWMTEFSRQWGSFLDTADSFSPEILQSFIDFAPEYRVHESLVDGKPNMPSGWLTFNQFFGRELNGGLRPIAEPGSNLVVTSPADCVFQHAYDIDTDSNIPPVTLKGVNTFGNIKQLIEGSAYSESFGGGTFVHYMLKPNSYHRYHLPVSGLVKETFLISGQVFMQVSLDGHEFKSSDSATTGYEFFQNRGVVTIDTSASDCGDIGVVAVIPVGMAHVSSVTLTAVENTQMAKGDEFGYFQFGGSDIIILFQEGVDPQIDTGEGYRLFGTPAARCKGRAR
ncbi:phosphatidylserine decarboxylase [Mycobacterium sp. 852002-53434_SCH5985345]|uniref:phosphatidylserine decarboxylase n=1 Tax=unclassified Mycobacterium TaxID=2642494 RepID=UPI0008013D43|nr:MULTISPECIES: phosphatidylserine decarboxylase [unclassified Mycobacterium]OBF50328.1 phosphatidylserine decarboxylase [Mycobacterium sp. 852002-53434_SCH5985345]OBF77751.1 phosphatidylserine decarboxylase [Mycobacterium sp. 852002-51613_SCH5001154]OBF96537.1 phosphatidylserine decarboxylase [Mycobacterium sp. 852014-52450_SCH5900713]